jgi:hypothetical protein
MLKNFLPGLWQKLRLGQLKNQEQENQQSQPPDLLQPIRFPKTSIFKMFTGSQGVIFWFSIVLFSLLIINFTFDVRLRSLKKRGDSLVLEVSKYEKEENEYKYLAKRQSLYQEVLSKHTFLSDKANLVYNGLIPEISVDKMVLEKEKFSLSASGPTPIVFSKLMLNYVKQEGVSYVVLKTARLNSRNKTYDVEVEVIFK